MVLTAASVKMRTAIQSHACGVRTNGVDCGVCEDAHGYRISRLWRKEMVLASANPWALPSAIQ